jgi:hypothetical protein
MLWCRPFNFFRNINNQLTRKNESGLKFLGRPMNPTQDLTEAGLRVIIRNPRAVRTWPNRQMIGFDQRALPDADLDALVACLRAMASSNQ